jgi:hypothetical protein
MTAKSPVDFDDALELDEFFGEDVGVAAIPDEEDIDVNVDSRDEVPALAEADIKKHLNHPKLISVMLSYEFMDAGGYSSWVTTEYHIREKHRS